MAVNTIVLLAEPEGDTRAALKRVARRLFAERGIREVTVREIARAAGQRNQGAVAYHFGTKEALVTELLTDGAERIEARRRVHLAALERDGGPHDVQAAVAAIVLPSALAEEGEEQGSSFNRFLLGLSTLDAPFVDRTLAGRHNEGYQRCLAHLRRLMRPMPLAVQNRRFVFLGGYVLSLLAQREAMLADVSAEHPTWRSPAMLDDVIRTAAALLDAPLEGGHGGA